MGKQYYIIKHICITSESPLKINIVESDSYNISLRMAKASARRQATKIGPYDTLSLIFKDGIKVASTFTNKDANSFAPCSGAPRNKEARRKRVNTGIFAPRVTVASANKDKGLVYYYVQLNELVVREDRKFIWKIRKYEGTPEWMPKFDSLNFRESAINDVQHKIINAIREHASFPSESIISDTCAKWINKDFLINSAREFPVNL